MKRLILFLCILAISAVSSAQVKSVLVRKVGIPPTAPSAPTLNKPADGATGVGIDTLISWVDVANETKYHTQLDTVNTFTGTLKLNDSTLAAGTTNDSTKTLDSADTYYWRVRAGNAVGWSSWSSTRSFTTIPKWSGGSSVAYDSVSADGQNAFTYLTATTYNGTGDDPIMVGMESTTHASDCIGGWRFLTGVPHDATIDSAFMVFYISTANGFSESVQDSIYIKGLASDDPPAFENNVADQIRSIGYVTPDVKWHFLTGTSQWRTTPDIKTIIQPIVQRAGYSSSCYIGIAFEPAIAVSENRTLFIASYHLSPTYPAWIKIYYH